MAICNGQKQKMLTQQRQQQHRLMTHSNQLRTQVVVSISLSHTQTRRTCACMQLCMGKRKSGRRRTRRGDTDAARTPVFQHCVTHSFSCSLLSCFHPTLLLLLHDHTKLIHILYTHTHTCIAYTCCTYIGVHRCKARKTN